MLLGCPVSLPRLYEPRSAWLRHGPFAIWLVRALSPRRIVELGTHHGYSYFCFCQAVAEANLTTDCFAVDTWMGDEHAGFYGDEIYELVVERNKPYQTFSKLLRKTFAEALDDIEDGSVDLLHVDGRHFYEDVKVDFESWIPKLSSRSVVLFHDTEVRENGFGVRQYWAELSTNRQSLNFPYEHGLGLLVWGSDVAKEIKQLMLMAEVSDGRTQIIKTFETLGEGFAAPLELAEARRQITEVRKEIAQARNELAAAIEWASKMQASAENTEILLQSKNCELKAIKSSRSWRLTKPLRSLEKRFRKHTESSN